MFFLPYVISFLVKIYVITKYSIEYIKLSSEHTHAHTYLT